MTGTMLRHMLTSRTGREACLSASEATCEIHVHATAVFRFLPAGVDMSCLIVGMLYVTLLKEPTRRGCGLSVAQVQTVIVVSVTSQTITILSKAL